MNSKRCALGAMALTLMLGYAAADASAQAPEPAAKAKPILMSRSDRSELMQTAPVTTFYLKNAANPNDANEILTALRLMLDPSVKMFLVVNQNSISLRALPDDLALAKQLIAELDLPKKLYRLTYTVNEMDGGKRLSQQHYAMLMEAWQRVTLKEGSKIPVSTGKFDVTNDISEQQMTYLDVGMNFDSTLSPTATGGQLKSKVERSAVSEEKPAAALPDPVIRQTVMEGVTMLTAGKPAMLGALDVPGTTHRLEIEVLMEIVP